MIAAAAPLGSAVKPSFMPIPHVLHTASLHINASRFPKFRHELQGLSGHEHLFMSQRRYLQRGISVYERFGGRGGRDLESWLLRKYLQFNNKVFMVSVMFKTLKMLRIRKEKLRFDKKY